MDKQRGINAIIFGVLFMGIAPFLGGLIWSIYIILDIYNQAIANGVEFSFNSKHLNLMYVTIASAYSYTILPAIFAGFIGGWWRTSFKKIWACLLFGIFAALVIVAYKYVELVVLNTPFMQATNWQYIQIISFAFALPTFFISFLLAYVLRDRRPI